MPARLTRRQAGLKIQSPQAQGQIWSDARSIRSLVSTRSARVLESLPSRPQERATMASDRRRIDHQRPAGDPGLPSSRRVRQQGPHRQPGPVRGALEPGQGRPRGLLGRAGAGCCTGSSPGTRCSTGSRRSPSGSSAASSTPRTTASTATATARTRTRPPSSGRASPATAACSATRTCTARSASSPTCSRAWASRRATSSRSTCR